jgi:hypothetical protein
MSLLLAVDAQRLSTKSRSVGPDKARAGDKLKVRLQFCRLLLTQRLASGVDGARQFKANAAGAQVQFISRRALQKCF